MIHHGLDQAVYGGRGMVATSQPLAAQAGLHMLQNGGNAIDAAIAAAVTLTVVEPTSNGIGGDAFCLVWKNGKLYGLNAGGRSPNLLTMDAVHRAGFSAELPRFGWHGVTVPGAPGAWRALSERFGRLPFSKLFEPAVDHAQNGYAITPVVARNWHLFFSEFGDTLSAHPLYQTLLSTFSTDGRAPRTGEGFHLPDHAQTLREIAETGAESFYRGPLANKIHAFSLETGGLIRKGDLAAFHPEWIDPVRTAYRGFDVWEIPPNGHGIVALMALNILDGLPLSGLYDPQTLHFMIESMKLAYADGLHYIADPACMTVPVRDLLSCAYAAHRREQIGSCAMIPSAGNPGKGGTVYLCTADSDGMMVSYIQSNYNDFGSGIVVPKTGICLHNRGRNFSLDPAKVNCLAPNKRPYHTIIPGFLTRNGQAVGPFGVMGAFMQPQGHVQVMTHTLDNLLSPQHTLTIPRWYWTGEKTVAFEPGFPEEALSALRARGHDIQVTSDPTPFGRGQIIWDMAAFPDRADRMFPGRPENARFAGGTDPRADGIVAAW